MESGKFDRASRALVREAKADLLCWLLGTPAENVGWRTWLDKKFTRPGLPVSIQARPSPNPR